MKLILATIAAMVLCACAKPVWQRAAQCRLEDERVFADNNSQYHGSLVEPCMKAQGFIRSYTGECKEPPDNTPAGDGCWLDYGQKLANPVPQF